MADANDDEWLYGAEGEGEGSKEDDATRESAVNEAKNGTAENDAFDDHNLEVN
jgi:hypothetical protein